MSYAKQTATPPKTTRLSSEPVTVDTEKPVTLSSIVFVSDLSAVILYLYFNRTTANCKGLHTEHSKDLSFF